MTIVEYPIRHKYKFELNLAEPCNCYYHKSLGDTNIGRASYTNEQLEGYANFIKLLVSELKDNRVIMLSIHGGNPLDELDKLIKFAKNVVSHINLVDLVIRSESFQEYRSKLLELRFACRGKLKVTPYCNLFSMIDETNITYDSLFYNICWLFRNELGKYIKVSVSGDTVQHIETVFDNYEKLVSKNPNLTCEVQLDYGARDSDSFNEDIVRNALENIRTRISKNEKLKNFVYCIPQGVRKGQLKDALMGNVICSMTSRGIIYPGYHVTLMTDISRDTLALGNISDGMEFLCRSRQERILSLEERIDYTDVSNLYRSVPYNHKDGYGVYNMSASEQTIKIHNLLTEYLSTRGV